MSSRETILAGLKKLDDPSSRLPEFDFSGSTSGIEEKFLASFVSVAGQPYRVANLAEANAKLATLECYSQARKIVSLVPGVGSPNVDAPSIGDPHELQDLDIAILEAQLGVAENGAVWLNAASLGRHRAVFVIAQHLVLVLAADRIVPTMHEAYERVSLAEGSFAVFVSGPSKTADIEQTLVIGAHGARSCTLFLVG
jgi:L-lactate dehydrogenase complex protein LldG